MGSFSEVTPGRVDIPKEEEHAFEKAEEAETKRRPRINLEAIRINPGAMLTLSGDEDIHATVVGGNRVEYEGQTMSLSGSALAALQKRSYTLGAASGSDYWMHEGKTLDEIRIAIESGQEVG